MDEIVECARKQSAWGDGIEDFQKKSLEILLLLLLARLEKFFLLGCERSIASSSRSPFGTCLIFILNPLPSADQARSMQGGCSFIGIERGGEKGGNLPEGNSRRRAGKGAREPATTTTVVVVGGGSRGKEQTRSPQNAFSFFRAREIVRPRRVLEAHAGEGDAFGERDQRSAGEFFDDDDDDDGGDLDWSSKRSADS